MSQDKKIAARPARFQANLNSLATIVFVAAILVLVNYLGFRHYKRVDLSQNRYYQLSGKTISLLKNLPAPVTVTTYLSNSTLKDEIENLLKEYKYYGGDKIRIERVDPALDLDRAELLAKRLNFGEGENLVIFEFKARNKFLNDYQLADFDAPDMMSRKPGKLKAFKGEQQFTSTIQALIDEKTSRVYFLTGHGEREIGNRTSPGGFGELELRIKRENIDVAPLNLVEQPDVPTDAEALIIAGPKSPLIPAEVQTVAKYLEEKGKVVLLQDPQTVSGLEPLMEKYGIQVQNDMVVARVRLLGNEAIMANATGTTFAPHPIVKAMQGYNLQFSSARSVAPIKGPDGAQNPKVIELVKTPQGFWGETNLMDRKPVYDPTTDIAGPLTLAMVYDGGEIPGEGVNVTGTRLLVVGSSSFLTNQNIDGLGVDFLSNSLNWMLKKEVAIGIGPKVPQEYALKLSPLQTRTVVLFSIGFVPGIAFVLGIIVWLRRRR